MISYMKKKGLSIIGIIPLLLCSCIKNKNAIVIINNGNLLAENAPLFIDIDEERIIGMMESRLSFILYEYSTACSHCNDSSANFEKYLSKYQYVIYRYNGYMSSNYQLLYEYDEETFPLAYSTPRVLIVSRGKAIDEVASSKLVNSNLFNSAINAFTKESKYLYTTTTLDGFNELIKLDREFGVFLYDSLNQINTDKYLEIYNNKDFDEKTILIDEAFASNELIEYVNTRY